MCNYTAAPSERPIKPDPLAGPVPHHIRPPRKVTSTPVSPQIQLPAEQLPNAVLLPQYSTHPSTNGQTLTPTTPTAKVPRVPNGKNGSEPTPAIDSMTNVVEDGEATRQYFGSSSAGSFTRQIRGAIDARLGIPATKATDPAPAPNLHGPGPPPRDGTIDHTLDYTLPLRENADLLVDMYWHYVDPLYPFLDRETCHGAYEGIWAAGNPVTPDKRIFLSTLFVIFALSTQLIESLDPDRRDNSSEGYFRQAEGLLKLNVWDLGSLELVQCLLLMSQYLQSANNPHPTWMIIGTAVRTALSLGLHLGRTSEGVGDVRERELLRRLWHGCVLMDRCVLLS